MPGEEAKEPGAESGLGSREAAQPRPRPGSHLPQSSKTDEILCRLRFFAWPYGARSVPRHGVGSGLETVWLLQLNSAKIREFRSSSLKTPLSAVTRLRSAVHVSPTPTHSPSACVLAHAPRTAPPRAWSRAFSPGTLLQPSQRCRGNFIPFCFVSFLSSAQDAPCPARFHYRPWNGPKLERSASAK